ncbi:hypothetical protein LguiA_027815 [Lonicera macranthoides]
MGKLDHEPHIHHFSHPHLLELTNSPSPQPLNPPPCSACKLPQSGYMYTCTPCNFTLHLSCTQFPHLITHPSHPLHPLSLLPTPTYPGGIFNCDACNRRGNGFSYHCPTCDFDLHVLCASKPLSISHHYHPDHPLDLTFRPPYETKGFSCDICSKIGSKQWLYRCVSCEFDVHMDCATATPTPRAQPQRSHPFPGLLAAPRPLLQPQQHHSFPVAQIQQQPLQHYHSFPLPQAQAPPQPQQVSLQHHHSYPGVGASPRPVSQQNYYVQGASTGAVQSGGRTGAGVSGNGLMNAMFQGLVEGAAQQVGQTLMQNDQQISIPLSQVPAVPRLAFLHGKTVPQLGIADSNGK